MIYGSGIICGSFDLIHPGYVRMFKESKSVCKKLIVALQDDPTIDRPEKCKPVQSLESRMEILQAIRYVDQIVLYNTEAELYELLRKTDYEVRILGSDYSSRDYTGSDLLKPVYYHERNHGYSTTALKEKIYEERLRYKRASADA